MLSMLTSLDYQVCDPHLTYVSDKRLTRQLVWHSHVALSEEQISLEEVV